MRTLRSKAACVWRGNGRPLCGHLRKEARALTPSPRSSRRWLCLRRRRPHDRPRRRTLLSAATPPKLDACPIRRAGRDGSEAASPQWLPLEKMSLELPIFAQPKLGLRNRGSQWTRERFLDHPGSLNRRRVRNDVADCNNDDHRDSECNDHSLCVSHDVATHDQSPIHRVRHSWCPCRYNDRALSNTPVTNFISAQIFLPATLRNRVAQVVQSVLWNAYYTPGNPAVPHN